MNNNTKMARLESFFKIVIILVLGLLSWFSIKSIKTAEAQYPDQDRFFDGPFICECWDQGNVEYGCGFSCYDSGNDCYASSYCFCPCC